MALTTEQVFFNRIKEIFKVANGRREQFEEQQRFMDDLLSGMTDEVKDEIRDGMTFKLKSRRRFRKSGKSLDKGGQLKELDPMEIRNKFQSISRDDKVKAHEAWGIVVNDYLDKMRKATDKDGNLLFGDANAERTLTEELAKEGKTPTAEQRKEAQEKQERARLRISKELFEPLVREGVIPEWAVPNEYSKTQRYLNAAYARYKETLEEQRQAKISGKAKTESDLSGAGNKRDMVKAFVNNLKSIPDDVLDALPGPGTQEERKRALGIGKATISFVMTEISTAATVDKLVDGKLLEEEKKSLDVGKEQKSTTYATIGNRLLFFLPKDKVAEVMDKLDENSDLIDLIKSSVKAPKELTGDILELVKTIGDVDTQRKVIEAIGAGKTDAQVVAEVQKLVPKIDAALEKALNQVSPVAGAAVKGAFEAAVDTGKLARMLVGPDPEAKEFIAGLAEGLKKALVSCMPEDPVFASVGDKLQTAFLAKGEANADALAQNISNETTVAKAFESVLKAATGAIAQATAISSGNGDDGPPDKEFATTANKFKELMSDNKVQMAVLKNVSSATLKAQGGDDGDEVEEQGEEELLEYEAVLTLIDEGGELGAMQDSIEKLIAQLEKGQAVIELVQQLGGTILNAANSGVEIAKAAVDYANGGVLTEAAMVMGAEVVPALKAAKLILRLSVEIKLMADRLKLWNRFRVQVGRAMKAGSPLSSSIQGFYNNKKEQVTTHGLEMAAVTVQIAGAICECTHEPHCMAAGKAVGAIGKGAEALNSLAATGYNELQLRRAWSTTREALNNPGNRKLGLKALMLNPTLAATAIAYAAKVERDPTARNFLQACGVGESTLDVGASEEKIREYMATLLYEDRKLLDPEQIRTNWQPGAIELTKACWVQTCGRAQTKASPPLNRSQPAAIATHLGELDGAANYLKPLLAADEDTLEELLAPGQENHVAKLEKLRDAAANLGKALNAYTPQAEDGTDHEEMLVLVTRFQALAEEHEIRLEMMLEVAKAESEF